MERIILVPSAARDTRPLSRILHRRRSPVARPQRARRDVRDVRDVVTVVLGGGQGRRLHPLTAQRSKPAVPVGGKYRLVDIAISNSLNSGLDRIFVLTQFNSASLNSHISSTYRRDAFSRGFVEVLAAEQTERSTDWYQGTADAVRKQLDRIKETGAREVVILSGDHLYALDLREFVARHRRASADVTVAVTPVRARDASQFGLVRVDEADSILEFAEKPRDPAVLDRFSVRGPRPHETHLASMGIYVFRLDVLEAMLRGDGHDFGQHLIPDAVATRPVAAFRFHGYWEDLGTIASYHRANLELAEGAPRYDFFVPENPIYTQPRSLPASRICGARLEGVLLSEGCVLAAGAEIHRCVLGPRSIVRAGTRLESTIVLGAEAYESSPRAGTLPLGIGESCVVRNAIVDVDARVGNNVVLTNAQGLREYANGFLAVRDGIIVVPRGATVPDGYVF